MTVLLPGRKRSVAPVGVRTSARGCLTVGQNSTMKHNSSKWMFSVAAAQGDGLLWGRIQGLVQAIGGGNNLRFLYGTLKQLFTCSAKCGADAIVR